MKKTKIETFDDITRKLASQDELTINFAGDSLIWGKNYCDSEQTIVARFAYKLAEKFPQKSVIRYDGEVERENEPVKNFSSRLVGKGTGNGKISVIKNGVGGDTVRRALNRSADFTGKLANGKFADITFLLFGTNDSLACDPSKYVPLDVFERNYAELTELILEKKPTCKIIPISPNNSNFPIKEYCCIIEKTARSFGFPFIDVFSLWQSHYSDGAPNYGQGEWLSGDPYHPSPIGAEKTAEFIFGKFLRICGFGP